MRSLSILYVEDDAAIAEMYRLGLTRAGFELTVAHDWPSARKLMRAQEFDLVLLDIMLPGIDGMQALAEIRGSKRWKHLPVTILSNSEMSTQIHARAGELGILAWLTKSGATPAQVARLVRRWFKDTKLTNGSRPA